LRVRGRSFLALVLGPEPPIADWLAVLDEQIGRSASIFDGRAVVLDLAAVQPDSPGADTLLAQMHARGIRVIGVEGVEGAWPAGGMWGQTLSGGRLAAVPDAPPQAAPAPPPEPEPEAHSLLVAEPVRSGQSVVFPRGDVTVIGSVASGAEVFAGGSVHIYGTLRGRAVAGFTGNALARVFCSRFQAELLSIDGVYKTADDVDARLRNRPVQAWLEGNAILMAALD
jgi:septum site-determining protein MinC